MAAEAGDVLVELERLREVVVGACVQPCHLVGSLGGAVGYQDRGVVPARPQHPAHAETVGTRHRHVGDQHASCDITFMFT